MKNNNKLGDHLARDYNYKGNNDNDNNDDNDVYRNNNK